MNRKLAAGLTALALLLGLTGCAPSRESAEQAADNALTAVQKWDEKTAAPTSAPKFCRAERKCRKRRLPPLTTRWSR